MQLARKIKLGLLSLTLIMALGLILDVFRQPENQITAAIYIGLVHIYQSAGRPVLEGIVVCRYRPTCSDYSIQAVRRFGILRGLGLTFERLDSCQTNVPMGTLDPIPEKDN